LYAPGLDIALTGLWRRWVLAGRRPEAEPIEAGWLLAPTGRYRLSMTLSFLLFAALLASFFLVDDLFRDESSLKRYAAMAGIFVIVALNAYLAAKAWGDRVILGQGGLVVRGCFRAPVVMAWLEVASIAPSSSGDGLTLRTLAGVKAGVSLYMDGYATLQRAFEARLPKEVWERADAFVRGAGNPPGGGRAGSTPSL
jgi:hypothetical protein